MYERLEIILLAVGGIVVGVLVILFAAVWLVGSAESRDKPDKPDRSWNSYEGRDQ